ncbi:MAG: DUF3857 domain-containing protein [Blastocatellia bacterium]
MKFPVHRKLSRLLSVFCVAGAFSAVLFAQDKDWRPVTPAELSSRTPVVEPGADAEATFWEVRVDDSSAAELALRHYVRVKIFTERGREDFSRHDVVFTKGTKIKDMDARVTKPDGTPVLVKKEDILEREIVRANGFKVKAKTFALPGLELGSIVEYRYKEVVDAGAANMRLILQREIPLQEVTYYVKPFAGDRAMYAQPFNIGKTGFEKDKGGYYRISMKNVPAFREEPSMLPEDEVKQWVYIYYDNNRVTDADKYWTNISKAVYETSKNALKPNDEVTKATTDLIAGAASDNEKLKRIYEFTKTQIRNLTYSEKVTDDEWKKVRGNKTPADVLKLKMGSAGDIDTLFGAMAKAAGYEVRYALSGSRNELFFNRTIPNLALMLNSSSIAVKVGTDWRLFSPASYFTPYGMLSWPEEDQTALITDSKELIWKEIPLSTADKSMEKKSGKFKLLADGTLVGEGRIEYTGHRAYAQKNFNRGDTPAEQEKTLKEMIQANILGTAEIESFTIENVSDPEKPFVYTYKIKVPGYASRTGRRIFFQPNVFKRSAQPKFTSSTRKYDVYINYPYSEVDEFTIELPDGFSLENAEAPGMVKDPQGIGSHQTQMSIANNGKLLMYKRTFSFGNGGLIRFPVQSYTAVKGLFEAFHRADVHPLALREASTAASTTKPE